MTVTKENKIIAKSALEAFGGKPKVSKYWDENNVSDADLLSTADRPYEGVTSYSTVGLSDYSIGYSIEDKPLRIEIMGAIATRFKSFPNIISTCAFNIINTKIPISHGEIFKGVIRMYYTDIEMEHILFTSPYLWDKLNSINFADKKVTWLLAVPISTKELLYAEKEGTEALEGLFEEEEIDIFDIERSSVL